MTRGWLVVLAVPGVALISGGCPGDDGSTPGDGSGSSSGDPTLGSTAGNSASESDGGTPDPDGTSTATDPTATEGTTEDPTGGVDPPLPVGTVDCGELPPGMVVGGEVGPLGFGPPCSPRAENTSAVYHCCSDDPAAYGGALPSYLGLGGGRMAPLFADTNNDLGTWGLCVDTSMIPAGSGLMAPEAVNCPIPCDPTWDAVDTEEICGPSRVCCQTQQLQPEDCVLDPDSGLYRPVTGADIGPLTDWSPDAHATHQDPNGDGCLGLAGGDTNSPVFFDCVLQLHVADRRGFCLALGPGQSCPHEAPGYLDACEMLNMAAGLR